MEARPELPNPSSRSSASGLHSYEELDGQFGAHSGERLSAARISPRYASIDAARGIALVTMVFYHCWRWLMPVDGWTIAWFNVDWFLCFLCKPGPPLFILCFGCMLGVVYRRQPSGHIRAKLWPRSLQALAYYKILFLAELVCQGKSWGMIWKSMLWQRLSNWVEVMDFYFVAMLLAPWLVPAWRALPGWARVGVMALIAWLSIWGQSQEFAFPVLQALIVGREPYHPFSFLPWSLAALTGLSVGLAWKDWSERGRWFAVGRCLALAVPFLAVFLWLYQPFWAEFNANIIFSGWKHPPRIAYVAVVTAYALVWLAIWTAFLGIEKRTPSMTNPLELMGRRPLTVYLFHFAMIFVFFGSVLGLGGAGRRVPDSEARLWAFGLCVVCYLVAWGAERVSQSLQALDQEAPADNIAWDEEEIKDPSQPVRISPE